MIQATIEIVIMPLRSEWRDYEYKSSWDCRKEEYVNCMRGVQQVSATKWTYGEGPNDGWQWPFDLQQYEEWKNIAERRRDLNNLRLPTINPFTLTVKEMTLDMPTRTSEIEVLGFPTVAEFWDRYGWNEEDFPVMPECHLCATYDGTKTRAHLPVHCRHMTWAYEVTARS